MGTYTELRRSVDELEVDLLEVPARGVHHQRLTDGHDTLLRARDGALKHEEVVLDDTVVREATHRGDALFGDVGLGRGVTLVTTGADAVDLLVELGTVVVTVYGRTSDMNGEKLTSSPRTLTGTRDGEHDLRRMPSTDTGDLAETLVGLTRKLLGAPTVSDTLETVTLGDGDDVDDLVLLEDGVDLDRLLEETVGVVDLVRDGTTVDLDLHKVRLLLRKAGLADLSVREHANDGAVLADTLELAGDALAALLGRLLGVAGEGLLLRAVPVLVEPTLDLVGQVGSPDGGEGAEATGSLDVADNTDDHHRRGLDDGNGLNDLALVHLCTRSVDELESGEDNATHWSQDGQGHERRGSCRPCSP
jgi:hypothetical protein